MAQIVDQWTRLDKTGDKPKRVRTERWGKGKRWLARWDEGGKRVSLAFELKPTAVRHLEDVGSGQRAGTHITKDKTDITIGDMWALWSGMKSGTSTSNLASYASSWKHIEPRWGRVRCQDVSRAELVSWLSGMRTTHGCTPDPETKKITPRPLGSSMRRNAGIVLKGVLELAVDERVITSNPIKRGDLPRQGESSRRYLSMDELDALLAAMPNDQMRLVIETLVMTGVRPGEAFGLRVGDLDGDRGRIRVARDIDEKGVEGETKNRKHRDVPVGGALLEALAAVAKDRGVGERLLVCPKGEGWTRNRWRPLWDKLDIDSLGVTLYELRHTAASVAIHAGANVKTVQAMLGHSSAKVTLDTYAHLWDDELDLMPGRMDKHMADERARFKKRREEAERQQADSKAS